MESNKIRFLHILNSTTAGHRATTSTISRRHKYLGLFPDFYDYNTDADDGTNSSSPSSNLFGLFPSDYEISSKQNDSFFLGYNSEPDGISMGQLSAPLMYILCMLGLYFVIITVAFMSALYSHRKQVGYNYDESVEYNQNDDSSSEENQLLSPESQQMEVVCESNEFPNDSILTDYSCESVGNDLYFCPSSSITQVSYEAPTEELGRVSNRSVQLKKQIKQILKNVKSKKRHSKSKSRQIKQLDKIQQDVLATFILKNFVKLFPATGLNVGYSIDDTGNETEMQETRRQVCENSGVDGPFFHTNNSSL